LRQFTALSDWVNECERGKQADFGHSARRTSLHRIKKGHKIVKISLLTFSCLFALAACSSDGGSDNSTGLVGGTPMPLLDTSPPSDDDPINGNTLPAEFTGGASLAESQYHYHCDGDGMGNASFFPAFYDDRTAVLLVPGNPLATWTVSGNNVLLDVPDLDSQFRFDNVTFVRQFTFTATGEQEREFTCAAFEDGTENALDAQNFSIDGLSNGATLETATNAWRCLGASFMGNSGVIGFFDDMNGILASGADPIARTTWEAISPNSVRIMGDFDTIVLQSLTVDGNNLAYTNAAQNGNDFGGASCSREPATFTVNNAANQSNSTHAANF